MFFIDKIIKSSEKFIHKFNEAMLLYLPQLLTQEIAFSLHFIDQLCLKCIMHSTYIDVYMYDVNKPRIT